MVPARSATLAARRSVPLQSKLSGVSLSGVDYVVIGVYLLAITAFGSWFARYQKTTRDYFLTGRTVPWWAICFTIVATNSEPSNYRPIPGFAAAAQSGLSRDAAAG